MGKLILNIKQLITLTVCAILVIIGMIFLQHVNFANQLIIHQEIAMVKVVYAMLGILGIFIHLAASILSHALHHQENAMIAQLSMV